jgi:hypothetical protein
VGYVQRVKRERPSVFSAALHRTADCRSSFMIRSSSIGGFSTRAAGNLRLQSCLPCRTADCRTPNRRLSKFLHDSLLFNRHSAVSILSAISNRRFPNTEPQIVEVPS